MPLPASLDNLTHWEGSISEPALPQIRYEFSFTRTTSQTLGQFLDRIRATLERLRADDWLVAVLAHNADVRLEIEPWHQSYTQRAWTFRRVHLVDAANALARDAGSITMFDVYDGSGRSEWALLKSGDLMLVDFDGKPAFPYGQGWYANVPHVRDSYYQVEVSGAIVSPDGTIEEYGGAIPCTSGLARSA